MAHPIKTGTVNHVVLTVTDAKRSCEFYTSLLGFQVAFEYGPRFYLSNGPLVLVVGPAYDPSQAIPADRFDENRVGLDHLSFNVGSREDLEEAVRLFDERGVTHGEITDLGEAMRLYVLSFKDPDGIQVELSAAYQ